MWVYGINHLELVSGISYMMTNWVIMGKKLATAHRKSASLSRMAVEENTWQKRWTKQLELGLAFKTGFWGEVWRGTIPEATDLCKQQSVFHGMTQNKSEGWEWMVIWKAWGKHQKSSKTVRVTGGNLTLVLHKCFTVFGNLGSLTLISQSGIYDQ